MGEGDRTGEWRRAGGSGGASLRSSALFPLPRPPSLQGDVISFPSPPLIIGQSLFPTRWHLPSLPAESAS